MASDVWTKSIRVLRIPRRARFSMAANSRLTTFRRLRAWFASAIRPWPVSRLREERDRVTEAGRDDLVDERTGPRRWISSDIGAGKDVGTIRVRDAQLRDVPHDVMFAFAFHAFWPDGKWMLGG